MAKKTKASDPSQAEQSVGEILSKTDKFIDKYWKQILIGIVAVILIVVGIIIFRHSYLLPREKNAQEAISPGEQYYANQQWEIALNGDSIDYIGFESIIEEYSGTNTANLAKFYAGICQYNLGDYEAALKTIQSYKGKDLLIAAQALAVIGNCEVNLGNPQKGADYFKKAAAKADNSVLSPMNLAKAALIYESLEDYKSALDIYNTIKTKYPESQEASNIEKYIERAKILSNK